MKNTSTPHLTSETVSFTGQRLVRKPNPPTTEMIERAKFIDKTYAGLKNPIEAARKWLRK